tara:strand:- start:27 stop:476 length:450 start_codon:yes stop_codon:yes gene_type:complete
MNTDKTTISKKRIVPMKVRKEVSYTTEATIWISSELYNDYLIELANRNNLDGNNEIQDFIENETIPWGESINPKDCNKVYSSVIPDYDKNIEDFRYSENVSFNSILSNGYYECLGINEVELDEGFIEKKEGGVIATRWREKQRNNIFLG